MPLDTLTPLQTHLLAGSVGLLVGGLVGFVSEARRARQQAALYDGKLAELREQLKARAQDEGVSKPAPRVRWTGMEIAAVIGAIGTLLGTVGTIYISARNAEVASLRAALTTSEGKVSGLERAVKEGFSYDLSQWTRVKETMIISLSNAARELQLDDKNTTGNCRAYKGQLRYAGVGPAYLTCDQGPAMIQFASPTTLLLAPAQQALRARTTRESATTSQSPIAR